LALERPQPPVFAQEGRRNVSTHGGVYFFDSLIYTYPHTHTTTHGSQIGQLSDSPRAATTRARESGWPGRGVGREQHHSHATVCENDVTVSTPSFPPGAVQGWRAGRVHTAPPEFPHPWGATSCRKAQPHSRTTTVCERRNRDDIRRRGAFQKYARVVFARVALALLVQRSEVALEDSLLDVEAALAREQRVVAPQPRGKARVEGVHPQRHARVDAGLVCDAQQMVGLVPGQLRHHKLQQLHLWIAQRGSPADA